MPCMREKTLKMTKMRDQNIQEAKKNSFNNVTVQQDLQIWSRLLEAKKMKK